MITKKFWIRKTLVLFVIFIIACSIALFTGCGNSDDKNDGSSSGSVVVDDEIVLQKSLYEWRLVGYPYTVKDYSSQVRVFDPNGKAAEVSADGKIVLMLAGEYTIVYPSKTERVYALLTKPVSKLTLSSNIEDSYPAGTTLKLPALSVENVAYEFSHYYIEIIIGSDKVQTVKVNAEESTSYLLKKEGLYEFKYFVVNDRDEKESVSLTTEAKKEKAIIADDLPTEVKAGEIVSLGYSYAFYDGVFYDVSLSVKHAGEIKAISGQSFTPDSEGEFTVIYTANINGETISSEKTVTASYSPNDAAFRVVSGTGETVGIEDLPSWNSNADYDKGLLLKGTSDKTKFAYSGILDLSDLTKDDNLIVFLPYSDVETDAYMTSLRVVFTDVHDANRKISLYFWATERMVGTNLPSTYATVEIGTDRYGISTHNDRGALKKDTGSTAWFSSFKGAHNNKSDTFTIQYDYASEILYITTERNKDAGYPMQQYVYLPLSGKGELPAGTQRLPEKDWFTGFTTGEVYMSVEFISNKNAGVYICEVAGKTPNELLEEFDNDFLVFDKEIKELPAGSVGREYAVPSAHLNENFDIEASISVSVKDGSGNAVALVDGKFTPIAVGTYTVTYTLDYLGNAKERVFELDILENPIDININVAADSVSFGDYMSAPIITLTGGSGKVECIYKVLIGNTELTVARNGKYLIDKEGELTVKVTAWDSTGYEKSQEFPIEVQNGYDFKLSDEIPTSIRIGRSFSVSDATVKVFEGGAYADLQATVKVYENGVEKAVVDGKFTASDTANDVLIEYSFAFNGGVVEKNYQPIVLPKNVSSVTDYIITDGAINQGINERGIVLTVSGNATIKMPNPIAAEKLLISVGFKKDAAVDAWEIILRDLQFEDMAVKLTLNNFAKTENKEEYKVNISAKNSSVQTIKGSISGDYVIFSFVVDAAKSAVIDYETQKTILGLSAFENGEKFIGFTGNVCMLETEITKSSANESELLLCQIDNQFFNDVASGYIDWDGVPPTIIVNGDKSSKSVSYGYEFTVPSAVARDVLAGRCPVTVRVIANGVEIIPSRAADQAFSIRVDGYKTYSVIYESEDTSGNVATEQFNVTVKDEEPPVLTVDGTYKQELKVGEKVTINSFTATDGQGIVKTTVLVKNNETKLTFVNAGDEYEFTESGTYNIVYRAVDEAGNVTRREFTIVVL